jgi:hypothetical protein
MHTYVGKLQNKYIKRVQIFRGVDGKLFMLMVRKKIQIKTNKDDTYLHSTQSFNFPHFKNKNKYYIYVCAKESKLEF